MYQLLSKEGSEGTNTLLQASRDLGQIFSNSILGVFPNNHLYKEIGKGMLKADKVLFKGHYKESILAAFAEKRILPSTLAVEYDENVKLQSATGSAKSLTGIKMPENKSEAKSSKFVEVSELLSVPQTGKLDLLIEDGPTANSMVIKGKYEEWKELKVNTSGLPNEVKVYLPNGFAIQTGTKNILSISHNHANDSATIDAAHNHLQRLHKLNKIFVPRQGERINTLEFAAVHKPYYIDAENKVRRAYYP